MKILMLNTFDEVGGAARAALRLFKGVRKHNIDAGLLVQFKTGNEQHVICNRNPLRKLVRRLKIFLGLLPVRRYPNKPENNFSPSLLPDRKLAEIAAEQPDIIHLHWLGAGFLRIETLGKLNKPLIWTLHDSWAFTGGCHVPFDCTRYRQNCGVCPVLGSSRENDLSRRVWQRKRKAWQNLDLTVVVPSRWMADCVRSSSLFRDVRLEVIPYGLDTEKFQPLEKKQSRDIFNLPRDKNIILFGAVQAFSDPNKGFHLLQSALQIVGKDSADNLALFFSAIDRVELPDLGMEAVFLGRIPDDQLAALYSAADVLVVPSKSENLPLTVMEAMACGTPCVAFRQGGLPDLVDHEISGYLAQPYDTEDLARGITWVLEDKDRYTELAQLVRQKVEKEFTMNKEAERYVALYQEIMAPGRRRNILVMS
ncbi:MAG: glycosyltransferase family 4 protein [Deltaproteobacteria bacterium]|jgi:glycosyltransferase involved in cell wall biosynthesis|nr:glycosyltransferase family 4 protein [Deltaproteobacteria bacterium]